MSKKNFLMRRDGHVDGTVLFKLGTMVGRQQTLGAIARKSSAAAVRYLKEMRDTKQYKEVGLPWNEFCVKYAGMDHKTANAAIARYEEFGEAYFNMAQLMPIQPSGYRLLAAHIEGNTLEHNGEKIAIEPENAARLIDAVRELRGRTVKVETKSQVEKLVDRLQESVAELTRAIEPGVGEGQRSRVVSSLVQSVSSLQSALRHMGY